MTVQSQKFKNKSNAESGRTFKNPFAKPGKYDQAVRNKLQDLSRGRGATKIYSKIGKVASAIKGNSGKVGIGLAGLAAGTLLAKTGSRILSNRKKKANSLSGKLTSVIKRQAKKL